MRAVCFARHGGPEVIERRELPDAQPGPGEMVVAVDAAALNHLDLWVRGGLPGLSPALPHVCGSDGCGTVVAAGPGVEPGNGAPALGARVLINPGVSCRRCSSCRAGEHSLCPHFRLLGEHLPGTFAERVAVPATNLYPVPAHLTTEEAAALGLAHLTAWRLLFTRGRLRAGEDVLIVGIGGGVALAALQLARAAGARVIATSRDPDKLARALELGAFATLAAGEPLAPRVRALTGGRGADLVVDSVGGEGWSDSLAALTRGGRLVTCGATAGPRPPTHIPRIFWNQLEVIGSTMGSDRDMEQMLAAVVRTGIRPVIDSRYPLDHAAEAYARLDAGRQLGKIVLAVR